MQTMHLFGSSVMTQRNHILYSTKQYFQKAYEFAVVIVLLITSKAEQMQSNAFIDGDSVCLILHHI